MTETPAPLGFFRSASVRQESRAGAMNVAAAEEPALTRGQSVRQEERRNGLVEALSTEAHPRSHLPHDQLVVNFPTKQHWRSPTEIEWIRDGLVALRDTIREKHISSIAIPPLGCGNGGLQWNVVRPLMEEVLGGLEGVDILVYEPTAQYRNVAKKKGVETLTPARALIAEMVRRYWVLGIECTLLETQKLAWFLERMIQRMDLKDPLDLRFVPDRYGPYANRLMHLLDGLDGSYLHCDKRLAAAGPFDTIWFEEAKRERLSLYLRSSEAKVYLPAIEAADDLIDGFQSPLGMEALATVDWLIVREGAEATLAGIRSGIDAWPAGPAPAQRKQGLFSDRLLELALARLKSLGKVE